MATPIELTKQGNNPIFLFVFMSLIKSALFSSQNTLNPSSTTLATTRPILRMRTTTNNPTEPSREKSDVEDEKKKVKIIFLLN